MPVAETAKLQSLYVTSSHLNKSSPALLKLWHHGTRVKVRDDEVKSGAAVGVTALRRYGVMALRLV